MKNSPTPLLKLEHLSKSYDEVKAAHNINLEIFSGEIVAIVGPSGCGKSTLLKLIAGFEIADDGNIILNGEKIDELPPQKRGIGMVFQDYSLFPNMNALQNVVFALHKQKDKDKKVALAKEYLRKLKMQGYEEQLPYQLSGGQQQRVAISRSFASNPKLILLDEPFSSIDEVTRAHARVEIRNILREEGFCVIMVTHDCKEAMSFADKICVMNEGRIIQVDIPEDIYFKPKDTFVASFMAATNLLRARVSNGRLESALGSFETDAKSSKSVVLSIRPEELHISGAESEKAVLGKIIHKEFTGDAYFYTISVKGESLVIKCSAYQRFQIDQSVYVETISQDSIVILEE